MILFQNTAALFLLVPAMFLMIGKYGAVGAAIVWVVLNVAYVVFLIPLMHSRLLRGEMSRWYISDVGIPLLIILAVVLPSKLLLPAGIIPYRYRVLDCRYGNGLFPGPHVRMCIPAEAGNGFLTVP